MDKRDQNKNVNFPDSVHVCPGCLKEGFNTYNSGCLRCLFNGKKTNHVLPYNPPQQNNEVAELFIENRKRISISGVQEKVSLILEKNLLRLTQVGEKGTHILKPIPRDLKKVDQVPANEHLTMQIAKQVYGIRTAENALIFFKNGSPAYITKRFDIHPGNKLFDKQRNNLGKEDFATLAGKTKDNAGPDFKYDSSYEALGYLIQKFVPAWQVEIEKYFSLVIFNFLFSNGDAHLKNFSLLESSQGDYLLSPAYDLINTRLHVDDSDFALQNGLFEDDYKSTAYRKTGHASKSDFIELGRRIGINEKMLEKLLNPFLQQQQLVEKLVNHSFLNDACKRGYLLLYRMKRNYLNA